MGRRIGGEGIRTNFVAAASTRNTSGDGTAIASSAAGQFLRVKELSVFLLSAATSETVTLKLGSITFPAVTLSSSMPSFTLAFDDPLDLNDGGDIYVNLTGTTPVGVFSRTVLEPT